MSILVRHQSTRNNFKAEDKEDVCRGCNTGNIRECCNKCGDGVCMDESCCSLFPHHHNTVYVICRSCYDDIDRQLTILIDDDKLRTLKHKIATRTTRKHSR